MIPSQLEVDAPPAHEHPHLHPRSRHHRTQAPHGHRRSTGGRPSPQDERHRRLPWSPPPSLPPPILQVAGSRTYPPASGSRNFSPHWNGSERPESAVSRSVTARAGFRRFPADILRAQAIGNGISKRFLPIHADPRNKPTLSLCRFEHRPLAFGEFGRHFRNQKRRRVLEIQHSIHAFIP